MNSIEKRRAHAVTIIPSITWDSDDELFIRRWLDGRPASTVKEYKHAINALARDIGGKSIRSITLDDLQAHAHTLANLKPATRRKRLYAIKSLFTDGRDTGYLEFNPASVLRLPKAPDELAERILDEATIGKIIAGETNPLRRVLLLLYYDSGGRISEVVNLQWQECHAHAEGGVITFSQAKGGRPRTVKIQPAVWNELMAFREATGYVFPSPQWLGQPIAMSTAWRWCKAAARLAGTEASPHWFRHAHASHSLDRGCPVHLVARTLGHHSIATTTRYAHARPGESSGDYLVMPELPELAEGEEDNA